MAWTGETSWVVMEQSEENFDGAGWAPASGPLDGEHLPIDVGGNNMLDYPPIVVGGHLQAMGHPWSSSLYFGPYGVLIPFPDLISAWDPVTSEEMYDSTGIEDLYGLSFEDFVSGMGGEEFARTQLIYAVSNLTFEDFEARVWINSETATEYTSLVRIESNGVLNLYVDSVDGENIELRAEIYSESSVPQVLTTSTPSSNPYYTILYDSATNDLTVTNFSEPFHLSTPPISPRFAGGLSRVVFYLTGSDGDVDNRLDFVKYAYRYRTPLFDDDVVPENPNGTSSNSNGGMGGLGGSVFNVSWNKTSDRFYETGIDRGTLYLQGPRSYSTSTTEINLGGITALIEEPLDEQGDKLITFSLNHITYIPFRVGFRVRAIHDENNWLEGEVISSTIDSVTIEVDTAVGEGAYSLWTIQQQTLVLPWNGLTNVTESGTDSAVEYYIDGRPYFFYTNPKEFQATISAYTYPDEFSSVIGFEEATDGVYLDSQSYDSFSLSYRTLIGTAVEKDRQDYKIHIIYNASVNMDSLSYDTLSQDINPTTFSFSINAIPVLVEGYRPTAHIIIDTRKLTPQQIHKIETKLYGTVDSPPDLPNPQDIFDLIRYGDDVIIKLLDDEYWSVEGPGDLVYMNDDESFVATTDAEDFGTYYGFETTE